MAAPVQAGDAVIIGFQSLAVPTLTAYVLQDGVTWKRAYNRKEEPVDQNGATRSKIRMDQYDEMTLEVIVDDPGDDSEVIIQEEAATIALTTVDGDSETWEVQDSTTTLAAGALKINMTVRKEVSMTY